MSFAHFKAYTDRLYQIDKPLTMRSPTVLTDIATLSLIQPSFLPVWLSVSGLKIC